MQRRMKSRDSSKYGKRHIAGVMNRTEAEYAGLLEVRKLAGEIIDWKFEAVRFILAHGNPQTGSKSLTYTPDFMVTLENAEVEFIDVKGGGPIDRKSLNNAKIAAEMFWQFGFAIEQKRNKKHGGGWHREEF